MTTYSNHLRSLGASGGGTEAVSINDRGQITGSYFNGTTEVGFL